MRTVTKIVRIGTAAIAAGLIGWQALAQTPTAQGPESHGSAMMMGGSKGMSMGMAHQHMGANVADPARLADMKRKLGITEKQTPAWDTYSRAVIDAAASLRAQHQSHMAMTHGSADDHIAVMTRMHEQRQQALDIMKTAAQTLLGALDEGQRAKAREILPGLASFRLGMMGHTVTDSE